MKRCLAFFERDARLALSAPSGLVMPFFSIVVTVAGFAFMSHLIDPHVRLDPGSRHAGYLTYVVLNLAFMLLFNDTLNAVSGAVRRDQIAGTFEPIVAASTPVPIVIAGSSLWPMLIASVQVAAYIAIGVLFGVRLGHANLSALAVIVVLALACAGALGVLATAAVLRWRQAPPSTLLVGSTAALLTGSLFPVSLLPQPLQIVSWLLPLTHALRAMRAAMFGAPLPQLSGDALWLSVAALLLVPLSLWAFRRALHRAQLDGTLASY